MASVTQIPLMNEIRFVPQSEIPDIYNQKQFDRGRYCISRLYFQINKPFKILKQTNDSNCIQIHTNNTDVELQIWDKDGNILSIIYPTQTFIMLGNIVDGEQLTTYQWDFRLVDILPGTTGFIYYAIKSTTPLFLDDEYVPSEPIWVKDKWKNTTLLTYTHDKNDYYVVFSLGPVFNIRVQGYYLYDESKTIDTQFNNQRSNTRTLNSEKIRVFKYSAKKIPYYMIDKIVEAYRCSNTKIEGTRFTKDDGASFEFDKSDTASLYNGSILLQEYNPEDSFTFLSEQVIPLFAADYPFIIRDLALVTSDNVFKWFIQNTATLVNDGTDGAALIVTLNGLAPGLGALGTFAIQSGFFVYINDVSESFVPFVQGDFKHFDLQLRLTVAAAAGNFKFINFDKFTIDWNGSLEIVNPSLTLQTISHTFANGGAASTFIRIFHNDVFTNFTLNSAGDTAQLLGISAEISTALNALNIQKMNNTVTLFDMTPLIDCRANLQTLIIFGTTVDSLTLPFNNGFDYNTNFYKLSSINLGNNELSTAQVNAFLTQLDFYCNINRNPGVTKGLALNGQTPAAPPSGFAVTIKANLITQGWFVTTD